MKRTALWAGIAALVLSCDDPATDPAAPVEEETLPESEIDEVVLDHRAPSKHVLHGLFRNATRREIANGVAHYQFAVRLGSGEFDEVRLHRVVRERRPHRPVRTDGAVFMTHGASLNFESIFLNAGTEDPSAETSVAVYLAANDIDVWGMDFAWTLVPQSTTDFSFMQDWGVERDVDHTLAAMSVARLIRLLTGQGVGRLNLLGYSYGVGVAYAAAGREAREHWLARDIGGIIAVDQALKFNVESVRDAACTTAAGIRAQIDAGTFQDAAGVQFAAVGGLAATAPDETSPIVPAFTNYQFALFAGANTFALQNPPATPFFHFVAGIPNEAGIPSDLRYAEPSRWIALLGGLPPYMPLLARFDVHAAQCDTEDVSIDDHLHDISVPILYVGAVGGIGTLGDFTSSLTASDDVTHHTVQLQPADQTLIDYGHADLFLGRDAPNLVWEDLHRWIIEHGRFARRGKHHARRRPW